MFTIEARQDASDRSKESLVHLEAAKQEMKGEKAMLLLRDEEEKLGRLE